jgi:hypothetical protein
LVLDVNEQFNKFRSCKTFVSMRYCMTKETLSIGSNR